MKRSRLERLRRRAVIAALRQARKVGHPLDREEVLALRVQILPTALRLAMAAAAILLFVAAYLGWPKDSDPVFWLEITGGILLLLFAILGVRRTLSNLADHMSLDAFEVIVEGVFSAIASVIDQ